MSIGRLTSIRRSDGSTRRVFQRLCVESDKLAPIVLEADEVVTGHAEASTLLARLVDGGAEPSPEDLENEMNVILDLYERGGFQDITDTIDDPTQNNNPLS